MFNTLTTEEKQQVKSIVDMIDEEERENVKI